MIGTCAVLRKVVEFKWEAIALKVALMVSFVQRLRYEQSLDRALAVYQDSKRNFIEHSENVTM